MGTGERGVGGDSGSSGDEGGGGVCGRTASMMRLTMASSLSCHGSSERGLFSVGMMISSGSGNASFLIRLRTLLMTSRFFFDKAWDSSTAFIFSMARRAIFSRLFSRHLSQFCRWASVSSRLGGSAVSMSFSLAAGIIIYNSTK